MLCYYYISGGVCWTFVLPKNGKSGTFDAIGTDVCKIKNFKKEGHYYGK